MTAATKVVDAKPLVDGAQAHLPSFEGATPALLDAHLFGWKREMVVKLETTVPIAKQREADFHQWANQNFMSSHAN